MTLMGLDVSTYVGMARVDSEITGKLVHFKGKDGFERLQLIAQEVGRTLDAWKPELVVIEAYAFGNKNSLVTLVECGTIVRVELFKRRLRWIEVPPTVLKKWTTGSGVAKKPQMAASVKTRWGYASPSDDIIDAVALAKMAEELGETGLLTLKGVKYGSLPLP